MPGESRQLAEYVAQARWEALPETVRHEGARAFVNWMGCVLGGCREPAVDRALAALQEVSGARTATVIGRDGRLDIFNAAFVNGLSNAIHSFTDTHLRTVAHPAGSTAAALLAVAEHRPVSGAEFLHAFILGIEVQCRIGNILFSPPAKSHFAFSMIGLTAGIGAAVAVGKVLVLTPQRMLWALGNAAAQAGGVREAHGTMTYRSLPGSTARMGLHAALLAEKDFTSGETILEGPKGFAAAFGTDADPAVAVAGLGTEFEILSNTYKPYPCGIVVHPIIDACLDLARGHDIDPAQIERVELKVHPLAIHLAGRRTPENRLRAGTSIYHWAAVSFLHRKAGLEQGSDEAVHSPQTIAVRDRVLAEIEEGMAPDAVHATVRLKDGRSFSTAVEHARGSANRPMTDADLDEKFLDQAVMCLDAEHARRVLDACWHIRKYPDVGGLIRSLFH